MTATSMEPSPFPGLFPKPEKNPRNLDESGDFKEPFFLKRRSLVAAQKLWVSILLAAMQIRGS